MVKNKNPMSCHKPPTNRVKRWPYEQYYLGDRDSECRKHGQGENHWTGAESLEWYIGPMFRDTMHGHGDYRWRYKDPDGAFITYEGWFFANRMHGYGMMSYPEGRHFTVSFMFRDTMHGHGDYRWRYKDPDRAFITYEGWFFANRMHGYGMMSYREGRVFIGLFYKDVRWGPGVERMTGLHANVGFWRGNQLIRLTWQPVGPPVAPDLTMGFKGPSYLDPYRNVLVQDTTIIGETNSALDLLKRYETNPIHANQKWSKLYAKCCTDTESSLCHKDLFYNEYYEGKIHTLIEAHNINAKLKDLVENNDVDEQNDDIDKVMSYFAWNNSANMVEIMKHCYQHEKQRAYTRLRLDKVLNGPRNIFKIAANHEINCRSLLMASYAGMISHVAQLVNEENVSPDVADLQGNTALMYAACGDNLDAIHFLVEAGANVNSYNDSCCTPLGVVLMRYLCVARDIPLNTICQILLPPLPPKTEKVQTEVKPIEIEWYINREHVVQDLTTDYTKSTKKTKSSKTQTVSMASFKTNKSEKRLVNNKSSNQEKAYDSEEDDNEDIVANEKKVFTRIKEQYYSKMSSQLTTISAAPPTVVRTPGTYLFTANEMIKEVLEAKVDKSQVEFGALKKALSRMKPPSKVAVVVAPADAGRVPSLTDSNTSYEKEKLQLLSKIELTILQLLNDGADPKLVNCPQPAIFLVTEARSPDLIKHIAAFGANVNEKNPEMMNYTALDKIISEPFSNENYNVISVLLEVGADACHRLKYEDPTYVADPTGEKPGPEGPTLLHAVLARKTDSLVEENIMRDVIELLLKYNADSTAQFHGRSPIDLAMSKKLDILDSFINSPSVNLNAIINQQNQTILMKLFSRNYFKNTCGIDKLPTLKNLLLYGADPLIKSFDGDIQYNNVFEFAQKTCDEISGGSPSLSPGKSTNENLKVKNRPTTEEPKKVKPMSAEGQEYIEALKTMRDCTRMLHVRWLQARLLDGLVDAVTKFSHRHWTMIIKEHKNGPNAAVWFDTARCLEIWEIKKTVHKKKYSDVKILRKLLSIIVFYENRLMSKRDITQPVTAAEKDIVEEDVRSWMKEYKRISALTNNSAIWKRPFVKPELDNNLEKREICFECELRLPAISIPCDFCGLVSFCSINCLFQNMKTDANNLHPCSGLLEEKYSPSLEE